MTERTDLTVYWELSPRLIEVADPSTEIVIQDLQDTLRSNSKQAGEGNLDNMDDDQIVDAAGKENLGGGKEVGITQTLQNAQLAFESRITPTSSGTATTTNLAGTQLTDNVATFQTDGVERGAVIINFADFSITEVLSVDSETVITHRVLRGGTDNDWGVGDTYRIWNIEQCVISGGNLVAVDELAAVLNEVFPTFGTQIIVEKASGTTAISQLTLEDLLEADQVFDQSAGLLHYYRRGTTIDLIPPKTVTGTQVGQDSSLVE
jgi:hypothetical protein